MQNLDIKQGTEAWMKCRIGKVTASRISDMMATTKSGWGSTRKNYQAELVCQRMTGIVPQPGYTNAAMQWGTDTEPKARDAYALLADVTVEEVAFVDHPTVPMSGASPDGLVGEDGLIEIKCPNTAGHIETLLGAEIDGGYIKQMQWQMACTGRKWCDFVSFDPRLVGLEMKVIRVIRDEMFIKTIEDAVIQFNKEIDAQVQRLKGLIS